MVAQQDCPVQSERRRHGTALARVEDELRRALEDRHAIGEEDGVMCEQLE